MARYNGPVCRLCRREGMKLFLKGNRCFSEKCAIEKRNIVPGEHGRDRRGRPRIMGYGQQLREKQKVKRVYGVLERPVPQLFRQSRQKRGVTGELLLQFLERRLDSVVYRLGFATSRSQARQLVRHGHIRVNGRRVDIPSFLVKAGDEVSLHQKIWNNLLVRAALGCRRRPWGSCLAESGNKSIQGPGVGVADPGAYLVGYRGVPGGGTLFQIAAG